MPNRYIISFAPWVYGKDNAGGLIKPKRDIIDSSKEMGFKEILPLEELHYNAILPIKFADKGNFINRVKRKFFYSLINNRLLKNNIKKIEGCFDSMKKDDVLFFQYPINGDHSPELLKFFLSSISKIASVQKIILIHDLESYNRGYSQYISWDEEKAFIKSFDHVILHNKTMIELFESEEDHCIYHSLDIFDYRMSLGSIPQVNKRENLVRNVFYAGNLTKSAFVKYLPEIASWNFNIYGPNYPLEGLLFNNLEYHGVLNSDNVVAEGNKYSFGLVWDGDSIHSLTGKFGEYMKFNNPYKMSCNIASGLPIITSRESGVAPFIEKNNLGILVNDLEELDDLRISTPDYNTMLDNVRYWQSIITSGNRIKDVLNEIL